MGKRLVKMTLGTVITWHKLSTKYSFAQWLFICFFGLHIQHVRT